jgi:hypothetical protein
MTIPATIDISGEGIWQHTVGDENCCQGWCNTGGFPKPCPCGGLIHADFGDEDSDCNYWLYTKCDRCGSRDDS